MIARSAMGLALALGLFVQARAGQPTPASTPVPGPAPGPVETGAAAQPFRLGALHLAALQDAALVAPNDGKIFGVDAGPAAVAQVLAQAGAPTGTVVVSIDALLVKAPGRVILLDTGLGPGAHGALLASLALAGVTPEQVTDVLVTHSHRDHVGGLATLDGRLTFPNAVVRMSSREWTWMQAQPKSAALATLVAARVKTFEPGERVAPGVTAIALDGHTPGHVGFEIVSGSARLLDIGDTAHSSIVSLAKPAWIIGFDNDSAQGRATRQAELARLADSGELVFAPHFPFPGVGRIVKAGDGYAWKPGVP